MIYLDNGATSYPKPRSMLGAMEDCMLHYCGNPGRSGHYMSIRTGEEVYRARRAVASVFHIQEGERLVFTKNTTEALNLGLKGALHAGDHVITTSMEHNSVLRPLKSMESAGIITQSVIRADREGMIHPIDIEKAIRPETKMIAVTAASNVTGTKMPLTEIGRIARRKGILFLVDGAQGAGTMEINVEQLGIDLLAVPGHKVLLGPLGTGGLYVSRDVSLKTFCEGGTGTESKSRVQPKEFPEGYEAGTINAPGIIGLGAAAEFVKKIGIDVIAQYEEELIAFIDEKLDNMQAVTRYGPDADKKTGITLFNIAGITAEEATSILGNEYGIAVRGGYHCAGLAHKTIGTWDRGGIRVSVGPFNTKKHMEKLADAVWKISCRQES